MADSGSLQDYLIKVPVRHQIQYTFSSRAAPRIIAWLSLIYQQFLRDVGQSFCGRMKHGDKIGEHNIGTIRIIDGVATLPPPPIHLNDFCRPIPEFRNLCVAVFNFSGVITCGEIRHFLVLLQQSSMNLLSFQNLFFHFIFQSPKANLSFLIDVMDYMEDNEKDVTAQLGGYWKRSYRRYSGHRFYNIGNSIQANVYLQGVYHYHQYPNNPTRKPYDDSCVGPQKI